MNSIAGYGNPPEALNSAYMAFTEVCLLKHGYSSCDFHYLLHTLVHFLPQQRWVYTPYLHAVCKGSFQFQRRPGISSLGLARSGRVVAEERRGRAADNKLTG